METSTIIWIVVAVLVVLALIAVAYKMSGRRKLDRQRTKADQIRQEAASEETTVRRHEADAAEQDALARQARAEADRKAAEAERLQLEAEERAEQASAKRSEHVDRLRSADEVDPDVPDHSGGSHADRSADGRDVGPGPGSTGRP
ncbi:MAG: hypothetical protein M3313_06980 [Actinomycetota bacterium]|nr:hypothetical protein [Actinomycetota bacterium]